MTSFEQLLNEQIGHEYGAHQQYVAIAVWFEQQTLPRLAAHFYAQALEERNHAMMLVQFLIDTDREVVIGGVDAPRTSFVDVAEPVAVALAQEKRVTEQINALAHAARDEHDYQGEQFLGWFLKEQVEEVASMSALLRICERAAENVLLIEDYLAREATGAAQADPTAPAAAGGAV
jgi:bacterioferritin B